MKIHRLLLAAFPVFPLSARAAESQTERAAFSRREAGSQRQERRVPGVYSTERISTPPDIATLPPQEVKLSDLRFNGMSADLIKVDAAFIRHDSKRPDDSVRQFPRTSTELP